MKEIWSFKKNSISFDNAFLYSSFIAIGILLSHLTHMLSYNLLGGKELATWLSLIQITDTLPISLVIKIALVYSLLIWILFQRMYPFIIKLKVNEIFNTMILFSLAVCLFSNIITSSILRLTYEGVICTIPFIAIIIKKTTNNTKVEGLIELLKFILVFCVGFPILIGGTSFISTFYRDLQMSKMQIYRHVIMSGYFMVGVFVFIIYPIINKILIIKTLEINEKEVINND